MLPYSCLSGVGSKPNIGFSCWSFSSDLLLRSDGWLSVNGGSRSFSNSFTSLVDRGGSRVRKRLDRAFERCGKEDEDGKRSEDPLRRLAEQRRDVGTTRKMVGHHTSPS